MYVRARYGVHLFNMYSTLSGSVQHYDQSFFLKKFMPFRSSARRGALNANDLAARHAVASSAESKTWRVAPGHQRGAIVDTRSNSETREH